MDFEKQRNSVDRADEISVCRARFAKGWSGYVACDGGDESAWREALADFDSLITRPDKVLKVDNNTSVTVINLTVGGVKRAVAVKREQYGGGIRGIVRSMLISKATRNFFKAVGLCREGIATVRPVAAICKKSGLRKTENVFITEYVADSMNLYNFLQERGKELREQNGVRGDICRQIAEIFAGLDKAGLWHRDAKSGNLLLWPEGNGYKAGLVDLDGIKRRFFGGAGLRRRALAKLGATVVWSRYVSRTDYMRVFKHYCRLAGIAKPEAREVFRQTYYNALSMRLLTLAKGVIKSGGKG